MTVWKQCEKYKKKAGIAPGLSHLMTLRFAYFASARFGGWAGHDLISVS
jgi:hypothetical protein